MGHVNVSAGSLENHASATPPELTVQDQCSNARTSLTIQVKTQPLVMIIPLTAYYRQGYLCNIIVQFICNGQYVIDII